MMRKSTSLPSSWLCSSLPASREEEDADAKARRVVRANNFTQQTNALDVDKHMCVHTTTGVAQSF